MLCLIFGLAAIFRFVMIYRNKEGVRKTRILVAQGALIVMTVYLLREADSATAISCFGLAGSLMVLTCLYPWARKPAILNLMVVAVLGLRAFSALFLGVGTGLVEDLGRDSTLTGRTSICTLLSREGAQSVIWDRLREFLDRTAASSDCYRDQSRRQPGPQRLP